MARPKKQTVEYFPHFANSGKTIFILESNFGNDGYAFWFKVLELLGITDGHVYDCRNTANWEFLLAKTRVSEIIASSILQKLADLEAIDKELWKDKLIWSDNFVKNLLPLYSNRKSDLPKKPISTSRNPVDEGLLGVETPITEITTPQNTQSKVNESKVKESKVENKVSVPETHTQSLDLCKYYEQLKPGESIAAQLPTLKIWIEKYGFDWTKEVIQICVSSKNKFIVPWIEKVLQNWQSEGKPATNTNSKSNYKSNKPSAWNLKDQRLMDPELEKKLLENSIGEDTGEDPMEMLKQIRGAG
jgi:hypothetical protein